MQRQYKIHYIFKFIDGSSSSVEVFLDPSTMDCKLPKGGAAPKWAELSYHQCTCCKLEASQHTFCPVALALATNMDKFANYTAQETAHVLVMTPQRDYSKSTTLQEGLMSLLGLFMPTTGCPTMGKLKPLVRFHLPFASLEENVFRAVSMHFIVQQYMKNKGLKSDFDLAGLENVYAEIRQVNAGISERLSHAAAMDASLTALSQLDYTASLVPLVVNETLETLGRTFHSYLEES